MDGEISICRLQRVVILFLAGANALIPTARLLMMLWELWIYNKTDMTNLTLHCFLVPLHLCVIASYKVGLLTIRTLGIVASEVAINILYFLGFVIEPNLNLVWLMTSFYLSFFVQANLLSSNACKAVCYIKPIASVFVFGMASGQLYLKQSHDIIVVAVLLIFGSIKIMAFMAYEDAKKSLIKDLRETKSMLTAILSAVPAGIFFMTDEHIHSPNAFSLNLLGCQDTEAVLRLVKELRYIEGTSNYSVSDYLYQDLCHFIEIQSEKTANFGQTQVKGRVLSWIGQATIWEGQPAAVFVVNDVTEVLQLERTTIESQYKNVMLRSVSHELKTPTNAILYFIQSVCEGDIPPWAKAKLEIASVSCKHLLMLIGDLLDFSQLVAGVFRLSPTDFDLRTILNSCIDLVAMIAEKKGIRVIRHFDPYLPETVHLDQSRLSQVLLNLLSNAVKFTKAGGQIVFKAILNDEGQMEVSVRDNGIGIAQADFDRLFTIFGRLEEGGSVNPQGVGLGLHISNALVMKLGGNCIQVESKLHQGSCFSFTVNLGEQALEALKSVSDLCQVADEDCKIQRVYSFDL